jgi:hypothetical protein
MNKILPDEYFLKVCNWLSPLSGEFEKKQLDTFNLKGRQDGIGNWLVETNEFKDWLNGTGKPLWCRGSRMFPDRHLTSC